MAQKKRKTDNPKATELPPVTPMGPNLNLATTKAVTPEEAMEHVARGWVLLQCDDDKTVVGCDHEIYEKEQE